MTRLGHQADHGSIVNGRSESERVPLTVAPCNADASPPTLAPDAPIAGRGDPEVQAIFGRAIEIAAADGRNMVMPAAPKDRIVLVSEVAQRKLIEDGLRTIPELFPEFIARKTDAEHLSVSLVEDANG